MIEVHPFLLCFLVAITFLMIGLYLGWLFHDKGIL